MSHALESLASVSRPNGHQRNVLQSMLIDSLIILISYHAAYWVRGVPLPIDDLAPLFLMILVIVVTLYVFGVYHRLWSRTSGYHVQIIVYTVVIATCFGWLQTQLVGRSALPHSVLFIGNFLSLSGFVGVRFRSRLISGFGWRWKAIWHGQFPKEQTRVLIVGAGESGQAIAWRMKYRFGTDAYQIMGFIDDDPDKQHMYVEGCRVLGTRVDIVPTANAYKVDLIVIAIHNISGQAFREILRLCEGTKAVIKVVPDLFASLTAKTNTMLLRDVQPEDLIGRSPITRSDSVDLTPMMGRVIMVTGAAGSIGSELSRQVMRYKPQKVVLVDNNESGLHDLVTEIQVSFPAVPFVPVLADITVEPVMARVFEKHRPQLVFHAAAYKHVPMLEHYPSESLRVNVGGTYVLTRLAVDYRVERFVLISTDKAVNPSSVMGASKRVCELMIHALATQSDCDTLFTAVRFGNVLGSRGSVVPTFTQQINNGGPVTITSEKMTRYFMSIPEAVNLIIHAACLTNGNDIYILKMGEEVRIVDLAERMIRMRGLRPYIDIPIVSTGIRPGEKLHEELYTDAETPQETVHFGIIKLNTWDANFDDKTFWREIARLRECLYDTQDAEVKEALQALTRLEMLRLEVAPGD